MIPIIGIFVVLVVAGRFAFAANSGTFCNESNQLIEFVCGMTPGGSGWVPQQDGCYHRNTGQYCRETVRPPAPRPPDHNRPPAPRPPDYNRPGNGVVCSAVDRGWEEHSRGHYNCNDCLRYHGQCVETCSRQSVRCEAQGYDRRGQLVRFVAQAQNRRSAENQAIQNCNYNARQCRVVGCATQDDVVSRRMCR